MYLTYAIKPYHMNEEQFKEFSREFKLLYRYNKTRDMQRYFNLSDIEYLYYTNFLCHDIEGEE